MNPNRSDTERLNWLETAMAQNYLFGGWVMGGSSHSLRDAIDRVLDAAAERTRTEAINFDKTANHLEPKDGYIARLEKLYADRQEGFATLERILGRKPHETIYEAARRAMAGGKVQPAADSP